MTNRPTTFTRLQATSALIKDIIATTIATAGAVTLSAAEVVGGLILRDPAGGARADLMPTAAALYEAIGSPRNFEGASVEFTIRNDADAAETITLTTNTGMTMSGTMTVAQNNSKRFLVVFATKTTATVYSMGTVVH